MGTPSENFNVSAMSALISKKIATKMRMAGAPIDNAMRVRKNKKEGKKKELITVFWTTSFLDELPRKPAEFLDKLQGVVIHLN